MEFRKAFSIALTLCVAVLASGYHQAGAQQLKSQSAKGTESSFSKPAVDFPNSIAQYKQLIEQYSSSKRLAPAKAEELKKKLRDLEQQVKTAQEKKWTTDSVFELTNELINFKTELSASLNSTQPGDKEMHDKAKPGISPTVQQRPQPSLPPDVDVPHGTQHVDDAPSIGGSFGKVKTRRPMVGGGDSKPQGAAGKSN